MEKEKIIELLQNGDIKYVTGITIRLNIDGKDYIRIDYMNNDGKMVMITQKIRGENYDL